MKDKIKLLNPDEVKRFAETHKLMLYVSTLVDGIWNIHYALNTTNSIGFQCLYEFKGRTINDAVEKIGENLNNPTQLERVRNCTGVAFLVSLKDFERLTDEQAKELLEFSKAKMPSGRYRRWSVRKFEAKEDS